MTNRLSKLHTKRTKNRNSGKLGDVLLYDCRVAIFLKKARCQYIDQRANISAGDRDSRLFPTLRGQLSKRRAWSRGDTKRAAGFTILCASQKPSDRKTMV